MALLPLINLNKKERPQKYDFIKIDFFVVPMQYERKLHIISLMIHICPLTLAPSLA